MRHVYSISRMLLLEVYSVHDDLYLTGVTLLLHQLDLRCRELGGLASATVVFGIDRRRGAREPRCASTLTTDGTVANIGQGSRYSNLPKCSAGSQAHLKTADCTCHV